MGNIANISIREGVASINLYGEIGELNPDVANFAEFIDRANAESSINSIEVHINSEGGSVISGMSIVSSIRNSEKPVTTIVEGAALSIAAAIALSGRNRHMRDFATLMIHDPFMRGVTDLDEAQARGVAAIREMLLRFINGSSTANKRLISKLMTEETYFTAEQAKEHGFIDKIIPTKISNIVPILRNDFSSMSKVLYKAILNSTNTGLKKEINMNLTEICKALGIDSASTEAQILNSIGELKDALNTSNLAVEASVKELSDTKAELNALNEAAENAQKGNILKKLDKAIENKHIPLEKREVLAVMSSSDLSAVLEIFPDAPAKASKKQPTKSSDLMNSAGEKRKGFKEIEKEDLARAIQMRKEDTPEFREAFLISYPNHVFND